uniref:Alpha-mannosidase n=1 Tax=Onchocerca volvulus TaxID=6282 RepID=A0A2K6VX37_ONCVO
MKEVSLLLLFLMLIFRTDLFKHSHIQSVQGDSCSWNKCNGWNREKDVLNIHLICHSHDDVGWIKTIDQYYYGSQKKKTTTGVQYILNTVMDELEKDESRRFSWCETSFLWYWLSNHKQRKRMQKLVQKGQIEFVGGGWVQNDEAVAYYVDIIDQMTLGLRTLKKYFGECGIPYVAWQIDPFGHSREMANLLALMDFEALFFSRLHFLEKEIRVQNSSLEFVWNSSDDLKTNILTSAFYGDSYGPPPGFCFDHECLDEPIIDDPSSEEYNAVQRVNEFIAYVKKQASHQRTNHVMLLMGSDFQYTAANQWYTNLDKLISLIRKNKTFNRKINIFYSTPSCYLMALKESHPRLPTKIDDFFPYASSNHSYWTGFFTSRPTLKGFIRQSSALLQLIKQLQSSLMQMTNHSKLEDAVALAQHHDSITGTARENVTKDYELRLSRGWDEAEATINNIFTKLIPKLSGIIPEKQIICRDINVTICNATRFLVFSLLMYHFNYPINLQINKVFYNGAQLKKSLSAPYELLIPTNIPALGFTTFFLSNQTTTKVVEHAKNRSVQKPIKKGKKINTTYIELTFNGIGQLISLKNRKTGRTITFKQEFFVYKGMGYSNYTNQSSGAYIFRPNSTQAEQISNVTTVEYIEGSLINETRQIIAPWISQVIRLYQGKNFVEFEWTIGPIPKELKNPVTKEIITRYTADIHSAGVFYTDSNGRQMMKRTKNYYPSFSYTNTEPIAGNYYPINNRIYIRDSQNQLTVLTDRSHGGTSLNDGQIELMLHRRLFYDDNFGVGEALDELGDTGQGLVVRGRHWIIMESPENSAKFYRPLSLELYNSPLITFAERKMTPWDHNRTFVTEYSALNRSLPLAINVLTMQMIAPTRIIIRLEHIFQGDEDKHLAQPTKVVLNGLFTAFDIISMEELNLASMKKRILKKPAQNISFISNQKFPGIFRKELSINLLPMEIATFEAEIHRVEKSQFHFQ